MTEYQLATHVHVNVAQYPVDDAHICLEIERFDDVCGSLSKITASMARGLRLVEQEILKHPDVARLTA
jgi:hypothetical protein